MCSNFEFYLKIEFLEFVSLLFETLGNLGWGARFALVAQQILSLVTRCWFLIGAYAPDLTHKYQQRLGHHRTPHLSSQPKNALSTHTRTRTPGVVPRGNWVFYHNFGNSNPGVITILDFLLLSLRVIFFKKCKLLL